MPEMGRIVGFWGDSKRKRADTAWKNGDSPEKSKRIRSPSSFRGGIHAKPRVIRGAHKFTGTPLTSNPWVAWPLMYLTHSFNRWDMGGVVGYGEVQDLCKEEFNAKLR